MLSNWQARIRKQSHRRRRDYHQPPVAPHFQVERSQALWETCSPCGGLRALSHLPYSKVGTDSSEGWFSSCGRPLVKRK